MLERSNKGRILLTNDLSLSINGNLEVGSDGNDVAKTGLGAVAASVENGLEGNRAGKGQSGKSEDLGEEHVCGWLGALR